MGPTKVFFAVMGLLLISSNNAQICSSHDIEGVEELGVCCMAECGKCGGVGCKTRAEAIGLTADDCCTRRIIDYGVYCNDSGAAPCIAGEAPTCSNGVVGVESDGICCVASCETCGGARCKKRAEVLGLTADACCTQRIGNSGIYCDDSEIAPCIIGSDSCDPSLSITLEWSDTVGISTSTFNGNVVDLYVTEPDGTIVYYDNPFGTFGFLDEGLNSGFTSPDSYIILGDLDPDGSVLGVYQAQVQLFDGSIETSWELTARTFGYIVWVEEGDFTTSNMSEVFSVSLTDYDSNCGGSFSFSS